MSFYQKFNFKKGLALIFLLGLTILVCCPLIFLISNYYVDFVWFIFGFENKTIINNGMLELVFKVSKILSLFVFSWIILLWYDFFSSQSRKTIILLSKISNRIVDSFKENKTFFFLFQKEMIFAIVALFVIQIISYLYFLCTMPLTYDEWFSYRFFSDTGFWTTLSNYNVPNNHIFYNLIAGANIKLGLDSETAIRLPSLVASFITVWYFIKMCKFFFKDGITLILCVFLLSTYPFVVYSFEARGYSFVNLFCMLMLYASFKLSQNYENRKYRTLFILSMALGIFSIPTFVYAIFPVAIVLCVYVVKKKNSKAIVLFVKDSLISVSIALLCYLPVLCFNNPKKLLSPNGGASKFNLSEPNAFVKIVEHLSGVAEFLFYRQTFLPIICFFIGISCLIYVLRAKSKEQRAKSKEQRAKSKERIPVWCRPQWFSHLY